MDRAVNSGRVVMVAEEKDSSVRLLIVSGIGTGSIGEHVERHVACVLNDLVVAVRRAIAESTIARIKDSSCSVGLL